MRRWAVRIAVGAALWRACAAFAAEPIDGPTATVVDTTSGGGGGGGVFYVLTEYNDKTVPNALIESQRASRGFGPNLRLAFVERPVPAGKVRLKLLAKVGYAAPIQTIFSSPPAPAEGVVEVDLQPGVRYQVSGVLDALRSEVWLEEVESRRIVSAKIAAPPSAEAQKAGAAEAAYTCCNLRYDREGWISDANWMNQPFVPAGTPIRLYDIARHRAKAMVGERPMGLGLDYSRDQQTFAQFAAKIALKEDPGPRIAGYPADVQAAIRDGKIVRGMTKEQVIVALGHPLMNRTRSLDEACWYYTTLQDEVYSVVFDAEQKVQQVDSTPDVESRVLRAE